jgi:heat shock protein HslJ
MKFASLLISLAFVACVALGCSGSTATLTSPSSLDLIAPQIPGTWNLVSIRPAGEAEQAKPSGANYTLTLVDGRLSTRADCNTCGGSYTLNGETLTAAPSMACTRAACPTMAFENTYMKLLGGESTVSLSGGTLELTSLRGVLRFTR